MKGTVLAAIRESCAQVTGRARSVRVDAPRLRALARGLAAQPPTATALDPAHHYAGDAEATLAYVLTLDAVNFGSGYFPHLAKEPGLSGYFTIATRLKRRFETAGPWPPAALRALAPEDCAAVWKQDLAVPEVAELMAHFARALRELGEFLGEGFDDRFAGPVEAAEGSAAQLVEILARMPCYRDVARYEELEVPFYKRAQLTAADLSAAFHGGGYGAFSDLDQLTLFADNLVPHVLRCEGALVYVPELARRIDAGELLEAGSPEEVEIRAAAVHAVERCVSFLRRSGVAATAACIDHVLWSRGQRPEFKARPRHRTRTTFY